MKLILIDVRGLQAAATGPYGNRSVETFTLNALAAQGVVFDRHLSVHPDAQRARAVWRSGCYQFAPEATNGDLLAVLHGCGVQTHLLIDASRPGEMEFATGWQHVSTYPDTASVLEAAQSLLGKLSAEASWLVWLELAALLPPWNVTQEIIEAYFNVLEPDPDEETDEKSDDDYEPVPLTPEEEEDRLEAEEEHEPWMDPVPGPVDSSDDELFLRLQKSYAAAVSQVDILLGHLLDGMPDDVLVIVTSDHGQALAEHGEIGPPRLLHSEEVQVPLLFAGAGCRPGRHVAALTASLDLAPTIAELAGGKLENAHGSSLVRMLDTDSPSQWPYVGIHVRDEREERFGLWTAERSLLPARRAGEQTHLYVKPDEVNDVRQHELERAEGMERTLTALVKAASASGPLVLPALEGE